jgi:hypothetical protein
MIVAFEKLDRAIASGHMSIDEIKVQAKKAPGCFAARYLEWKKKN